MSTFIQDGTGVVVSVADHKDDRFTVGFKPYTGDAEPKRSPGRPKKADSPEPAAD